MASEKIEIRDQRNHGWYWIDSRLVQRDGAALGTDAIAVYNVLASFANNTTQDAFPGMRKIATMLGISKTTVLECIDTLTDNKWIVYQERVSEDGKTHLSHVYTLIDPPGTAAIPVVSRRRKGGTVAGTKLSSPKELDLKDSAAADIPPNFPPEEKPTRPRDVVFDAVALHIFGLREVSKSEGGRIGQLSNWLKKLHPAVMPEVVLGLIDGFVEWYREEYDGIALPRRLEKFQEHWMLFEQGGPDGESVPSYRRKD